jgi:two-component system response regulator HydG
MRAENLDIKELLDIDGQAGTVRFAGQPAILLDAVAMGILRRQIVDTFGHAAARGVFTRFGFAHGWRMAEAMRSELTWDSPDEWRAAGARVHTLQGHIHFAPGGQDPFSPGGATVDASYEAEQHQLHLGRSDSPVCWALAGAASGYLSRAEEKPIYVLEDRCMGKGDAVCRFRARTLEQWGAEIEPHLPFYQEACLDTQVREVTAALKKAEQRLRARRRALGELPAAEDDADVIARSPRMRLVLELARTVARVDSTVLITGESGVGKERIARLVHEASARAAGPLLAINCGAIAETLLESELFGHARGAFTGASRDRPGLFEAANGGTLFLDEVGELPAAVQVTLLRTLQERQVRRVGENQSRSVDVRIVAATNRDLAADVASGRFRRDLYYRLRVVELRVPPLRERREDILPLSRVLLADAARRLKRPVVSLSARAADQLVRHQWPGNVRELENAMERAVALAQSRRVEVEDLPEDIRQALPVASAALGVRPLGEVERDYILAALERCGGNQARTAAELGIGPSTLYRKLKQYEAAARGKRS